MSTSLTRLAAIAEQFAEPAAPSIPKGWTHIGTDHRGKPHYRTAPGIAVVTRPRNPVADLMALPREKAEHNEGGTCPHCLGRGRYTAHRGHFGNEKCFRCDGKGILDRKDLAFLKRRMEADEPICLVVSA
ncbi:hypothetical protein [Vreelandella jeotgali]|uniref:hypothetical protein n=1 Tax=Vreelandella jeotgali TaxID=553386 RepID=UPI000348B54A|nr:hypothetical protein [Halomonas jeotgali]